MGARSRPAPQKIACSCVARTGIDRDIRDFLTGRTDGEKLLHALYDPVFHEPVPERLLTLLQGPA